MKRMMILAQATVFLFGIMLVGCKSNAQPPAKKDGLETTKEKKLYNIQTKALKLKKGMSGKASFHIVLAKGAKVHPKAPFKCAVSASKGLKISKTTLRHPDTLTSKDKRDVTVPVVVTATAAGKQSVNMDCNFFICTAKICARKEEIIKINANVQ